MNKIQSIILGVLLAGSVSAQVNVSRNPASGLYRWNAEENNFSVEFIQLIPDFVRAIYASHNFPEKEIEEIAGYCVFGSIIKNTGTRPLHYRVADWYYLDSSGARHAIKTKTQWIEQWRKAGIVFSWTLLPDEQTFANGDWQQGFTTVKLPREEKFTLVYSWDIDGKAYQARLNMQCPPGELPNE